MSPHVMPLGSLKVSHQRMTFWKLKLRVLPELFEPKFFFISTVNCIYCTVGIAVALRREAAGRAWNEILLKNF